VYNITLKHLFNLLHCSCKYIRHRKATFLPKGTIIWA